MISRLFTASSPKYCTALFAAYTPLDGVFALVAGVHARWWVLAFFGMLSIIAGLTAFLFFGLTVFTLLLMIGDVRHCTGHYRDYRCNSIEKESSPMHGLSSWVVLLCGFEVILLARPPAGALAVIWVIGAYSLIIGTFLIVLPL